MSGPGPGPLTDRNLLFGLLALQMNFIQRDALIAAMNAWVLERHRPLGEILVERGDLERRFRSLLEPMVDAHVERHGGDPSQSLAALSSIETAVDTIRTAVNDSSLLESLATIAPSSTDDPYATRYGSAEVPPPNGVRYRKVRNHAKGGLGIVFVARDEELNREVALKEIQEHHADDPHNRARFLVEAEVTGGLEHPGIVPVYGLGSYSDGRPFYAMRFIKGDSLKHAINLFHADASLKSDPGARTLALQKLLRRFLDVCNAIAYAHSRGVLHRDLKPDNVMVGKYGETLVVDWGLAKQTARSGIDLDAFMPEVTLNPASAGSGSHHTLPGSVIGTPAYMSPEQAAGRLDLLGPASDVYSLGATLYTLLTGKPPFFDHDVAEVIRKVEHGEFPRPREIQTWIDPALEAVCLKAMALKAGNRYATPKALADDIDRWLAGSPVLCWKEPAFRKLRRWVDQHQLLVTSSVSLLATAVVALGIGLIFVNAEKSKALKESRLRAIAVEKQTRESKLRGIAVEEKTRALARAEEAGRKEAEAASRASRARDEAVKVLSVLVDTFKASDPIGLDGLGVRKASESVKTMSAREILDRSAQNVERLMVDQPLIRATLMDTMGEVYRSLVELDTAERMIRWALDTRTRLLPADDPDRATSLLHMGWLHQDRGRLEEAERCYEQSYRIRSARFGEGSRQAIDAQARLAILWMFEEDFERARLTFEQVIEKLGHHKGINDPSVDHDIALARLGLAAVHLDYGRIPEAFIQSNLAIRGLMNKAEADHFFLAIGKLQKGLFFLSIKQYDWAIRTLREGLGTFQEILGPSHPYLAFFEDAIGQAQELQGKVVEAEASYRRSLALIRAQIGLKHPKARVAVDRLASLLEQVGRHDEAQKLFLELLEELRSAYGAEHVWVADALVDFSSLASQHGDFSERKRLLNEALKIYRKPTRLRPKYFTLCLNNLADCLLDEGAYREAEVLLRETLPVTRRQYGESSRSVGVVLHNLSRCLTAQGQDNEETDQVFAEAISILKAPLGGSPETGIVALTDLAGSEQKRGLHDRAEAHAREALENSRLVYAGQPAKLAQVASDLGVVLARAGRLSQALPAFEEAIGLSQSAGPKAEGILVKALSLSALVQASEGNRAASREAVARALRELPSCQTPDLVRDVTWAASRFSSTVTDPGALEALARRLDADGPSNESYRLVAAAALLRAGRYEPAVRRLEAIRRLDKNRFVVSGLFLAVGYRKLGRFDLADEARRQAEAEMDRTEKKTRNWTYWLELGLLRQEVDALFREAPGELPANVFAPDLD